jgi:nitroimidazol reductase NimA-like FMN-containing flavoprotein (pyridoxamine 5'-phosphate oxidase superfamily)
MIPRHLHPRRLDRSRDAAWIRRFLEQGGVAVLAWVRDGGPRVLPRVFAFDGKRAALYLHGAAGGELGSALAAASGSLPVAVTVFEMGRLLPAEEAGEFGVEYASVVLHGEVVEVGNPQEAERGLTLLMEKYAPHLQPGVDYQGVTAEDVVRTTVLRVDIRAWSGKAKEVEGEVPGAYRFEELRERRGR